MNEQLIREVTDGEHDLEESRAGGERGLRQEGVRQVPVDHGGLPLLLQGRIRTRVLKPQELTRHHLWIKMRINQLSPYVRIPP